MDGSPKLWGIKDVFMRTFWGLTSFRIGHTPAVVWRGRDEEEGGGGRRMEEEG